MDRTLLIIKPDAVRRHLIGTILKHITDAGFEITGLKMVWLTRGQAEKFYAIHCGKDFYEPLVHFMMSGPIVAACLKHDDAPQFLREVVGATDPRTATSGTIRALYGTTTRENAVHASAPGEDPAHEIRFFFADKELYDY